jgi:hypothetical protein
MADDIDDRAFANEEAQVAAKYPDYRASRAGILALAIQNGQLDLDAAYHDYNLAAEEQYMSETYGPEVWERNRVVAFQQALKGDGNIETAMESLRTETTTDDRAERRAARLEELKHSFQPADELERQSIERERVADGEAKAERTAKAMNREERRREQLGNINRANAVNNEERLFRAGRKNDVTVNDATTGQRVGVPRDRYEKYEELDMIATAQLEAANADIHDSREV